jgi:hypothetical protein
MKSVDSPEGEVNWRGYRTNRDFREMVGHLPIDSKEQPSNRLSASMAIWVQYIPVTWNSKASG